MTTKLSHIDAHGQAHMVDVHKKRVTKRVAVAQGTILMSKDAFLAIENNSIAKGDVLATARIAGIMAAKKTADLIPLCHPVGLSQVAVEISSDAQLPGYHLQAKATVNATTGVEMEALTAVTVACLTIYDMAKAIDKSMTITNIQLVEKSGGKSGHWMRDGARSSF